MLLRVNVYTNINILCKLQKTHMLTAKCSLIIVKLLNF